MINRVENQSLVVGIGGKIRRVEQRFGDGQCGLAIIVAAAGLLRVGDCR